jgi:hypothetical protein
MPDYNKAKIYKIWSPEGAVNEIFYGATTGFLSKRTYYHKNNNNCPCNILFKKYDDVRFDIIERCSCNNKIELNKKLNNYIQNNDCLNKTKKETKKEKEKVNKESNKEEKENNNKKYKHEWYVKNKELIKERNAIYRINNKEKIKSDMQKYRATTTNKIKKSERYNCSCGCNLLVTSRAYHLSSQKHKDLINNINK